MKPASTTVLHDTLYRTRLSTLNTQSKMHTSTGCSLYTLYTHLAERVELLAASVLDSLLNRTDSSNTYSSLVHATAACPAPAGCTSRGSSLHVNAVEGRGEVAEARSGLPCRCRTYSGKPRVALTDGDLHAGESSRDYPPAATRYHSSPPCRAARRPSPAGTVREERVVA